MVNEALLLSLRDHAAQGIGAAHWGSALDRARALKEKASAACRQLAVREYHMKRKIECTELDACVPRMTCSIHARKGKGDG